MMGQATTSSPAKANDLSLQEAFVSLLMASARSDGSVSPHEANQIEHVVAAMKMFRGHGHEMRQGVFASAAERIKEHGTTSVVQAAAATIPPELRTTVFAVAIDLMLSDSRMSTNELHFADTLRGLLNVDRDTAATIVDVLTTKNAG